MLHITSLWNNLHLVIPDEGYSRNWSCGAYLMKVIPETGHVEHT
jgi:hypothetical protein